MPLPPVQIQLVASGMNNVLNSLKTIEQAVERQEQNLLKSKARSNSKIEELAKTHSNKMIEIAKNEHDKINSLINSQNDQQIASHKKHTSNLANEVKRRNHLLSSVMQSMGLNRVPGMNVAGSISGLGGGGEVSGGSLAMGAVGGVLVAAAAVTAGAIAKSVGIIVDAYKMAASDYVSAALEIGGGFSISGSMVSAAKIQRMAVNIANAVFDKADQVPASEIQKNAMQRSKGTEFSPLEILEAQRLYTEKTGKPADFDKIAELGMKLSTVTSTPLNTVFEQAGVLKTQFPTLNDEQIKSLLMKSAAIGAKGTVELRNLGDIGKMTGEAASMKGDLPTNIAKLIAMIQAMAPIAGSPAEAVTQGAGLFRTIGQFASKHPTQAKEFGISFEEGKLTDYSKVIENLVILYKKTYGTAAFPKEFASARAGLGLQNLAGKIDATTESGQREQLQSFLKNLQDADITMEDFNKKVSDAKETVEYQLKSSFIELGTQIGTALLPHLKDFADKLPSMINDISTAVKSFYDSTSQLMTSLAPLFIMFGQAMIKTLDVLHLMSHEEAGKSLAALDKILYTVDPIGHPLEKAKEGINKQIEETPFYLNKDAIEKERSILADQIGAQKTRQEYIDNIINRPGRIPGKDVDLTPEELAKAQGTETQPLTEDQLNAALKTELQVKITNWDEFRGPGQDNGRDGTPN